MPTPPPLLKCDRFYQWNIKWGRTVSTGCQYVGVLVNERLNGKVVNMHERAQQALTANASMKVAA